MTRKEYVDFANALKNNYTIDFDKLPEFCDMAISALSENKGEWIRFKDFEEGYVHIKCSKCGQYWSIADHTKIFKYCFNCGADMKGGE